MPIFKCIGVQIRHDAFLKVRPIVDNKYVEEGLRHSLPERAHKLIPLNMEAIEKGKAEVVKM